MSDDIFDDFFEQVNPHRQLDLEGTPANEHFDHEVISLELEEDKVYGEEIIVQRDKSNPKELQIGYLAPDEDPIPHEFEDGESLTVHRTQDARDQDFMQKQEAGLHPMIVERYVHSAEHYSVMGTGNYPDREFDVAPSCVYTPCTYNLELLSKGEITEEELVKQANTSLHYYSDYVNGNSYNAVVEMFEYDEADEKWVQSDIHRSPAIGLDEARSELKGIASGLGQSFDDLSVVAPKAPARGGSSPGMSM